MLPASARVAHEERGFPPACPECGSFDLVTWRDDEDQESLSDDPSPTNTDPGSGG